MRVLRRLALVLLIGAASANGADSLVALETCFQCHGEDGLGVREEIPILAGNDLIVLEDALLDYREGDRVCDHTPAMCELARLLSDDDIADFAEYFAALPYVPAGEGFDPLLAARGAPIHEARCGRCHGTIDDFDRTAGRLFGQRTAHLRHALGQYRAGHWRAVPTMQRQLATLDDDELEALLHHYASYRD